MNECYVVRCCVVLWPVIIIICLWLQSIRAAAAGEEERSTIPTFNPTLIGSKLWYSNNTIAGHNPPSLLHPPASRGSTWTICGDGENCLMMIVNHELPKIPNKCLNASYLSWSFTDMDGDILLSNALKVDKTVRKRSAIESKVETAPRWGLTWPSAGEAAAIGVDPWCHALSCSTSVWTIAIAPSTAVQYCRMQAPRAAKPLETFTTFTEFFTIGKLFINFAH